MNVNIMIVRCKKALFPSVVTAKLSISGTKEIKQASRAPITNRQKFVTLSSLVERLSLKVTGIKCPQTSDDLLFASRARFCLVDKRYITFPTSGLNPSEPNHRVHYIHCNHQSHTRQSKEWPKLTNPVCFKAYTCAYYKINGRMCD